MSFSIHWIYCHHIESTTDNRTAFEDVVKASGGELPMTVEGQLQRDAD